MPLNRHFSMVDFMLREFHRNKRELKNRGDTKEKGGVAPPKSSLTRSENRGVPKAPDLNQDVPASLQWDILGCKLGRRLHGVCSQGVRRLRVSLRAEVTHRTRGQGGMLGALSSENDNLAVRQSELP